MANLPEKNVVLVDKITNVPTDSNLFINANGEFKQASVNDVVNSSTVVSTAVETAINTAVQDSIDSNFKQTSGSPILLTDSAEGVLTDFKAYGKSTQQIKMIQGYYDSLAGTYATNTNAVCNEKPIPCKTGDNIEITVDTTSTIIAIFYNGSSFVSSSKSENTTKATFTIPSNANYYNFDIIKDSSITPSTVGAITITVNGSVGYPRPDYPQTIKSVADGGYFDGELLGGYYDGSGVFVYGSNTTNVGNKNPIPCKGGDVIKIIYEESISAITVALYDENMMFIDRPYKLNTNEFVITAPSNAKYMNFHLSAEYIITPTTAKPITVTINGKYALIVKSKGKNLFDISEIPNTANMTNNQNGTLTITNSYSNNTYKKLSELTDLKIGQTYTLSFSSTSEHQFIYLSTTSEKWENGMSLKMTQNRLDSAVYFYGNTSGVTTISNIQIEENTVVTPYEPYKESVTYIPLNEPLRSSLDGTVTDEVSLTECKRKFGKFVLNGTENWYFTANTNMYMSLGGLLKPNGIVISDYYVVNKTKAENTILVNNANVIIYDKRFATVDKWKAWLAENNVTLIYELAEPITETIEPVDIVTYDNVTYLTASDNAEMELEYPTSKVAGIASIGYSKGRKAEYEVELLKAQLLELQTAMVNSL